MEDALDRMLDLINASEESSDDDDNIEDPEYNDELKKLEDQIRLLVPADVNIDIRPIVVEVPEYDMENNVLSNEIRDRFKTEVVFEETDLFTSPLSTTNTMEGYLSNVSFHERDLIQELIPDEDVVIYRCNYGKVKLDCYEEPLKVRKTNRGRKKKEKKKKLRKKQGEGNDFNSQITFVVSSRTNSPNTFAKVYKFKIFRTGKLQLPGVHPHLIDDVIECTKIIVRKLNFYLHPGEENPTKQSCVVNVNPVMKNYKFIIKLPPGHIIDMEALRNLLSQERLAQFTDVEPIELNTTDTTDIELNTIDTIDTTDTTDTIEPSLDACEENPLSIYCAEGLETIVTKYTDGTLKRESLLNVSIDTSNQTPEIIHTMKTVEYNPKNPADDSTLIYETVKREKLLPINKPPHPRIFMLKYTRQDTKLSIKFSTPIFKKPKKMTRINIFMRGKINILGAFDTAVTRQICEYLHWLFTTHFDQLVVREGVAPQPIIPTWVENIEQTPDDIAVVIVEKFLNWLPPLPEMTELEYDLAMEFINKCYAEGLETANTYIKELLEGTELESLI